MATTNLPDAQDPVTVTDPRVVECFRNYDGIELDIGALWELCVSLEWDRAKTVDGIADWLRPATGERQPRILDTACGSGFPGLDLAHLGYDITCSDGSPAMLDHFRRNAKLLGVDLEPRLIRWEELSAEFDNDFDVVMCRGGGSLIYAGTWDEDQEPDRGAIAATVEQFVSCLRPGGRLYLDITRAEDLARTEPVTATYPEFEIAGRSVTLQETVTVDLERRIRHWRSEVRVDGNPHEFTRRSHYLSHDELLDLLHNTGLVNIHDEQVQGESYAVYVGTLPKD